LFLRQPFLLAQFRDFESEVRLVHFGFSFFGMLPLLGVGAGITTACGRHSGDISIMDMTFQIPVILLVQPENKHYTQKLVRQTSDR